MDTVPRINNGLAKHVNISILVASYLFNVLFKYNSLVYLAFEGFPDIILIMKIKADSLFNLKRLFINGFKMVPINSGTPYLIIISEITKNGNNDGKILFFHIVSEKLTEFKIDFDSVRISKHKKNKTIIINTLIYLFINSPFISIFL